VFGKGTCAGPRIVVRVVNESGPDRVVQHVLDRVIQVALRVEHPGSEPRAEQVARALVPVVEALCVLAVEVLDSGRELPLSCVEDEVDVVVHQAERVAFPGVALRGEDEEAEVGEAVVVVAEDRSPVDAARSDVEGAVREVCTKNAGHEFEARRRRRTAARDRTDRHPFATLSLSSAATVPGSDPRTMSGQGVAIGD